MQREVGAARQAQDLWTSDRKSVENPGHLTEGPFSAHAVAVILFHPVLPALDL